MSSSPYPSRSADGGAPGEPGAPFTYPSRPVVLVIDDEAGVRESLRIILQDDFEVLEAADGAAALEIVRSRRIDVALLDVRMPGEHGPAVLPRILALSETIAVILMTAVPQVRTAVDAIKAGAYDYVIKPFEPDEILLLVRQAAQHRLLEREVRYFIAEDEESLAYIIKLGTIPLHIWSSRLATLERPDWCILDLDPKGAPFAHVVELARGLRGLCEELGLPAYV